VTLAPRPGAGGGGWGWPAPGCCGCRSRPAPSSWNRGVGSDSSCQTMTKMDRPIATMPAGTAAGDPPGAFTKEGSGLGGDGGLAEPRASYGLPCPVDPRPLGLPAASLTPGRTWPTTPAAQGSGTGSGPPRARRAAGVRRPGRPGDLIQPLTRRREPGGQLGELGVELGQVGARRLVPRASILASRQPCWSGTHPQNASTSGPRLAPNRVRPAGPDPSGHTRRRPARPMAGPDPRSGQRRPPTG
jgi:hypothetical protein